MKRITVLAAVLFTSVPAFAAEESGSIGARSSAAIVVDGLFGVQRTSFSSSSSDSSFNSLAVGTQGAIQPTYFSAPRLGLHFFAANVLSVGASFRWWHQSSGGGTTILGVAPRIGAVIPAGENGAIWLRGGVGYENWDVGHDTSLSFVPVGGEIQYVSTSYSHFGWTIGPTFETDVSAKQSSGSGSSRDSIKRTTFGLSFGVLFDF